MINNVKHLLIVVFCVLGGLTSCSETPQIPELATSVDYPVLPILAGKEHNPLMEISLTRSEKDTSVQVTAFHFDLEGTSEISDLENLVIFSGKIGDTEKSQIFGQVNNVSKKVVVPGQISLLEGDNKFWVSAKLKGVPELTNKVRLQLTGIEYGKGNLQQVQALAEPRFQRFGLALRQAGQDQVNTYRIPGLATTNEGTLIAVYDNRYNDPVDLQEDIDVGMSRSTDGGQSWEPMKAIMDMGTYGGLPEDQNGIGDPAVLVDRETNTIWVAALWLHGYPGKRAWNASEPGMQPKKTGQLILVKSEDDGKTWSDPINITPQTKERQWQLFFNGPGAGITMKDGTLVFAAQYKDKDRIPHATIIYSKDNGETWQVGTGAKSETTEAQVVELPDGALMLNTRDDRNRANRKDSLNGRSVLITRDMGKSWVEHPTSRKALIEPNCMASIIGHELADKGQVLFFSNPNSKTKRNHITIKTSFDGGMEWPEQNQIELYENGTYGYSCLTMVDEDHIGILYEGVKELYFQKIPISELVNPQTQTP